MPRLASLLYPTGAFHQQQPLKAAPVRLEPRQQLRKLIDRSDHERVVAMLGQKLLGAGMVDRDRQFESLDLNALRMIVYATLLVLLMIWRPEGLLGERELFQKRRARKSGSGGSQPKGAPDAAPTKA